MSQVVMTILFNDFAFNPQQQQMALHLCIITRVGSDSAKLSQLIYINAILSGKQMHQTMF
jgi:hypothetical protein